MPRREWQILARTKARGVVASRVPGRFRLGVAGCILVLLGFLPTAPALTGAGRHDEDDAGRDIGPDVPGREEALNRSLWEGLKGTSYAWAKEYVARAQRAARDKAPAEQSLPTGWTLAPAGRQIAVGRLPYAATPYAGKLLVLNTGYYENAPQEISVVDPASGTITSILHFDSLFPSAAAAPEGDLYVSGGWSKQVYRIDRSLRTSRTYPVGGYTAGLAAVDASHIAVALLLTESNGTATGAGKLIILNTRTGTVEREVEVGYFPYAVLAARGRIFVAVLGEDKVRAFDPTFRPLGEVTVGARPMALCLARNRLYTVNSSADTLTVLDPQTLTVLGRIDLRWKGSSFGAAPTSCAVGPDGRLYATLAGMNAVAVVKENKVTGFLPTGWYPTEVGFAGGRLYVLSAKGVRTRRPNPRGPQTYPDRGGPDYVLTLLQGSLALVDPAELQARLPEWTVRVSQGSPLFSPASGLALPIRHIFYIVKENRTYDQVLGDLGRGNGDPALTLFGRDVTPAHHSLAREFVTLDNFYANGEISVLGHSFTTSGHASPFLEWLSNAGYPDEWYPFGTVPATFSPRYLWDALEARGIDYRVYGEAYYPFTRLYTIIVQTYGSQSALARAFYAQSLRLAAKTDRGHDLYNLGRASAEAAATLEGARRLLEAQPAFLDSLFKVFTGDKRFAEAARRDNVFRERLAQFLSRYRLDYSPWNLSVSDLDRARVWLADFRRQLSIGRVASLHYIWLPNDHTAGVTRRFARPEAFVAQNDAALGLIAEAISRSPIWRDSLILVEEDDAQDGPDHVDATRTVALAAGPFVRRSVVVSDRYDQLSLLRTIEVVLKVPPLGLGDALAVPMFGIFSTTADQTPFKAPAPSPRLLEEDSALLRRLRATMP